MHSFIRCAGAMLGWPLRIGGRTFCVPVSSFIAWRCLRKQAGESAGLLAAVLLALYLTFDIPSVRHGSGSGSAYRPAAFRCDLPGDERGRAFASGMCAGVALLFNGKALFIALACLLWTPRLEFLAGFALPNILRAGDCSCTGRLESYWKQVWVWGARYSADTFMTTPVREGVVRTTNWLGFHATLAIAAVVAFWQPFFMAYGAMDVYVVHRGVCRPAILPAILLSASPVFIVLGTQGLDVTAA